MKNILITGTTIYADNRGVSAMAAVTTRILKDNFPDSKIVIWHTFPESSTRSSPTTDENCVDVIIDKDPYKYILKLPFRLLVCILWATFSKFGVNFKFFISDRILREYANADMIISLNFGDVFTDNYGPIRSFSMIFQNLISVFSGKPVIFFPQTIGPFNTKITKTLAKYILNRSHLIMAREIFTEKYLIDLGVDKNLIRFVPDTAFLLEASNNTKVNSILEKEGFGNYSKDQVVIGMSLNPSVPSFSGAHGKKEEYEYILCKVVDYLIDKLNAIVIFVPNVTHNGVDTRSFGNSIRENILQKDRVISINGEYTAEELKGIIGRCDLFIATLTHTFIAAVSMNVPAIAIAYGAKTLGIMRLVGVEKYIINFNDLDLNTMISKVDDAWENRDSIKMLMLPKIESMNKDLISSGKLLESFF